jgi:uncharacterized protein
MRPDSIQRWTRLTAGPAVFVVLFFAGVLLMQSRLIFFPERLPADYAFGLEPPDREVFVTTDDGERIHALWFRAEQPAGVVLYFHGNAGSLRTWQDVRHDLVSLGYDLFIIDYRGYGKSSGRISEPGLYADAKASYDFLRAQGYAPDDIVVYGRSIGTGVASELAHRVEHRALVLESPFFNLVELARGFYPWLLPALTLRYRFYTDRKIAQVNSPILFIHGERDELIGPEHSRRLHALVADRGELVIVPRAGHNDVAAYPQYRQALASFLARTGSTQPTSLP